MPKITDPGIFDEIREIHFDGDPRDKKDGLDDEERARYANARDKNKVNQAR